MSDEKTEWQSIADLMAVLMVVFLFISVIYLMSTEGLKSDNQILKQKNEELLSKIRQKIREHEEVFTDRDKELQETLQREFGPDLKKWNAELTDNTFIFQSPDALFKPESSELTGFEAILKEFCPRYLNLLAKQDSDNKIKIKEIRIEGHTSSIWHGALDDDDRYLKNVELSQRRAYSVLDYCFKSINPENKEIKDWLTKTLRANGMAFANPITLSSGLEDTVQSKRVEFRVTTEETNIGKVYEILDDIEQSLNND